MPAEFEELQFHPRVGEARVECAAGKWFPKKWSHVPPCRPAESRVKRRTKSDEHVGNLREFFEVEGTVRVLVESVKYLILLTLFGT